MDLNRDLRVSILLRTNKSIGKCLRSYLFRSLEETTTTAQYGWNNKKLWKFLLVLVRQFLCTKEQKTIALISVLSTNVVTLMCSYLIPFVCIALSISFFWCSLSFTRRVTLTEQQMLLTYNKHNLSIGFME